MTDEEKQKWWDFLDRHFEKIANLAKSFAGEDDTFGDKANEITEKIKNIMKVTNKTPEQILVAAKKQGGFDKLYSAWQAYQNSKQ